jgi:hypothetical protein
VLFAWKRVRLESQSEPAFCTKDHYVKILEGFLSTGQ